MRIQEADMVKAIAMRRMEAAGGVVLALMGWLAVQAALGFFAIP